MPHFVIDCSKNVIQIKSPKEIIQKVYDTAMGRMIDKFLKSPSSFKKQNAPKIPDGSPIGSYAY